MLLTVDLFSPPLIQHTVAESQSGDGGYPGDQRRPPVPRSEIHKQQWCQATQNLCLTSVTCAHCSDRCSAGPSSSASGVSRGASSSATPASAADHREVNNQLHGGTHSPPVPLYSLPKVSPCAGRRYTYNTLTGRCSMDTVTTGRRTESQQCSSNPA